MDDITTSIARYATEFDPTAVGAELRAQVIGHIVDTFGCAIAGVDEAPCRVASAFAHEGAGAGAASLIGGVSDARVEDAAFANACMARCLDFNDVYNSRTGGHPSDTIFGVFAAAEASGASGARFVSGVNVAYEVFAAMADRVALRDTGWDQTVLVAVATVAGICTALEASQTTAETAVSLAVTACNGLRVSRSGTLSAWKGCATPFGVRNACALTRLAALGMTAPARAFRGPDGFVDQVAGELELGDIGTPRGVGPGAVARTALKFLPAEFSAQAPLEMLLQRQPKISPDEVARITISAYDFLYNEIGGGRGDAADKWDPKTRETADHSLPYLVAVALTDGSVDLSSFTPERIRDPGLRPLMRKIRIVQDPDARGLPPERRPVSVTIELRTGDIIEERCEHFVGDPSRPASDHQIDSKFMSLVGPRLDGEQAQQLLLALRQLYQSESLGAVGAGVRAVGL